MLSKKRLHAAYACLILHGIMLHIDGICYAFNDAMLCNDDYLCKMSMYVRIFVVSK